GHTPTRFPKGSAVRRSVLHHLIVRMTAGRVGSNAGKDVAGRIEQNFDWRILVQRWEPWTVKNLAPLQRPGGIELQCHYIWTVAVCAANNRDVPGSKSHDRRAEFGNARAASVFDGLE